MEWIRAIDRLPDEGEDVLVSYKSAIDGTPCVDIARCEWSSDFQSYSWYWSNDMEAAVDVFITHWMPLPKPPDN